MRSPGGRGEEKFSPVSPLIVALVKNMVKKIINLVILALLVVRLVTIPWPSYAAGILTLASVVIISVAAGIAIANLLHGGDRS